jgi:SAM-dependent methyltransferase
MGIARALRSRAKRRAWAAPDRLDSWLVDVVGDRLDAIDAACARGGGAERFALFRDLDADVWALLLTQQYDAYPNIRALLPDVPDPSLQELWNGTSGVVLAAQSVAFYRRLCERFAEHSSVPLSSARALDFGCGWGRLTRFLARDVARGRLYGCDPAQQILDACAQCRVPAVLARSEFVPEALPFDEHFDLAFAFSVFTHLSERAHERCLRALHAALGPGALLVVTVRPPAYARLSPLLSDVSVSAGESHYVFVAHPAEESHPQYEGGEMTYGEAIVTLPYVRERWTPLFDVVAVDLLLAGRPQHRHAHEPEPGTRREVELRLRLQRVEAPRAVVGGADEHRRAGGRGPRSDERQRDQREDDPAGHRRAG